VVQCLVKELGADVNKAGTDGGTALCIAAQEGHLEVVQCLVKELGADVNRAEPRGIPDSIVRRSPGRALGDGAMPGQGSWCQHQPSYEKW
jgi:hypothetical protein